MATFLANEINITKEDITGSTAQVEIKDKRSRVFEDIFFSGKSMNQQSKKVKPCVI